MYIGDAFLIELVTKVKPNINLVEVHPQLSNNMHPVDGALVHVGSLWFCQINFELKMAGHHAPTPHHGHNEAPSISTQ